MLSTLSAASGSPSAPAGAPSAGIPWRRDAGPRSPAKRVCAAAAQCQVGSDLLRPPPLGARASPRAPLRWLLSSDSSCAGLRSPPRLRSARTSRWPALPPCAAVRGGRPSPSAAAVAHATGASAGRRCGCPRGSGKSPCPPAIECAASRPPAAGPSPNSPRSGVPGPRAGALASAAAPRASLVLAALRAVASAHPPAPPAWRPSLPPSLAA